MKPTGWTLALPLALHLAAAPHAQCEIQKLTSLDGNPGDSFGSRIAMSGDTLVVAAPDDSDLFNDAGAVYVFDWDGSSWVETTKLVASDASSQDTFGNSVAIEGNTLVVGASDADGLAPDTGAAYVFTQTGGAWLESQKLAASDGMDADNFGVSCAIDGDTIIVGAPFHDDLGSGSGAAYVFVLDGTDWVEEQKLLAGDGTFGDRLGISVAVSGDRAVVGAHWDDVVGSNSGAAYVYDRVGSDWQETIKLASSDLGSGDEFGYAVDILGTRIAVAAWKADVLQVDDGAVYLFEEVGGSWVEQDVLSAPVPFQSAHFGSDVDLFTGDRIGVGAWKDDFQDAVGPGSACVFEKQATEWVLIGLAAPSDGAANDDFGLSIAMGQDRLVSGAKENASLGATYAYKLPLGIETYGTGLAGWGGFVPDLSARGCPSPGETALFVIDQATPGASGCLMIGLSQASTPILGGTILVDDAVYVDAHSLLGTFGPGGGRREVEVPVPPNPNLVGTTVYGQAGYIDFLAPQLLSLTNGVEVPLQ